MPETLILTPWWCLSCDARHPADTDLSQHCPSCGRGPLVRVRVQEPAEPAA